MNTLYDLSKSAKRILQAYADNDIQICIDKIKSFQLPNEHEFILIEHIAKSRTIQSIALELYQSPENIKFKIREALFAIAVNKTPKV